MRDEYGADRVAQIITFGKLQARAAVRDVGRVLGLPFGQVNKVAELIPNNPAKPVTLQQAIDGEPKLQQLRDDDEGVAPADGDRACSSRACTAMPARMPPAWSSATGR